MDPSVYGAAMLGKEDILDKIKWPLLEELAPNGNTVLHIAAQYGRNEWIQELLRRLDSSSASLLLRAVNCKGETALHVAAREGHSLVITALVQHAKLLNSAPENSFSIVQDILTSINEDGDTALHMSLRSALASHLLDVDGAEKSLPTSKGIDKDSSLDSVTMLIFPDFAYPANKAGETPLYLAAECECFELVKKIVESSVTCPEPDTDNYSGPGGRTALHAAVSSNHEVNTSFLLDWKKDLARRPDTRGWTPLHCAAEFGHAERVTQLLGFDISLAYLTAMEEGTALHIAAQHGWVSVITELVSQCPGCWEMVDARGRNVLHVAIENGQKEVIKFFENSPPYLGSLINQKDSDGNTPIHLAARYCRVLNLSKHSHARPLKISFNKENQSPLDLLAHSDRESTWGKKDIRQRLIKAGLSQVSRNTEKKKSCSGETSMGALVSDKKQTDTEKLIEAEPRLGSDKDYLPKTRDASLIAAALVATVTFTAGITVPGGFNSNEGPNQGTALLLKSAAFQIFVVVDAVAFSLSTLALLTYLMASFDTNQDMIEVGEKRSSRFTYCSVVAMVLAFITGTFSVLSQLPALAIVLCVVIIICFAIFILISWDSYFKG